MAKDKLTLREFIHLKNREEEDDIDMSVDGTDCYIAVAFGDIRLTPAGERQFKSCLDGLHVDGHCIVGDDDDYEAYDTWLKREATTVAACTPPRFCYTPLPAIAQKASTKSGLRAAKRN